MAAVVLEQGASADVTGVPVSFVYAAMTPDSVDGLVFSGST